MRILIVGSDAPGALEKYYLKYLIKNNAEAAIHDMNGKFSIYYHKNFFNKLIFRTGFSTVYKELNKELLNRVKQFKPTLVWVFKGMEVYPDTIRRIQSLHIKVVNFNPDNPFLFSGSGSGNKNVSESVPLYDLHFSYNIEVIKKFEKAGIKCLWLPFGYDVDEDLLNYCHQKEEIRKVCFVGTPDKIRAYLLNSLAQQEVDIDLYGRDWKRFKMHERINVYNPVYDKDFWSTLYRYRIQLNILRPHNRNSHCMRSFEIPGVSGVQLAERTYEHACFFEDGKEIFLFSGMEECKEKIMYLLNESANNIKYFRYKAREKCELAEYSYRGRAKQFLSFINSI